MAKIDISVNRIFFSFSGTEGDNIWFKCSLVQSRVEEISTIIPGYVTYVSMGNTDSEGTYLLSNLLLSCCLTSNNVALKGEYCILKMPYTKIFQYIVHCILGCQSLQVRFLLLIMLYF